MNDKNKKEPDRKQQLIDCNIGAKGAQMFSEGLKSNQGLVTLDLEGNYMYRKERGSKQK